MENENLGILERFLNHNRWYVNRLTKSRRSRWLFVVSPKLRRLWAECGKAASPEEENAALAAVVNAYEEGPIWRAQKKLFCLGEDLRVFLKQRGKRKIIDHSDRRKKDYYSVAEVVKNEARYLREHILFYMATGADRIYLYDNGSTDNLMEVLAPFLESGFVVYQRWPGQTVQTAAYRDAVRRTRRRSKWLAIIDADEFLFSPKGKMPEQLKAFEQYPGVGANWVMYGPNGHDRRPEGLVMDAYTTTHEDYNAGPNCHIKSIVQPKKVFCIFHTHYAIYKGKGYAVGEDGVALDNRTERAFSRKNNHQIFRINHYCTRSLEDLEEKCAKGRADGAPNANYEDLRREFDAPMRVDDTIKPYADIVRSKYKEF